MSAIVTVLAGGWSASRVDLERLPGYVICVNDAAIYSPRCDAAVSMDRLWAEGRMEAISESRGPVHLRGVTLKREEWHVSQALLERVKPFACDHESTALSDYVGTLHGRHSGFCAVNLAYQMRPKICYLVGFDFDLGPGGERHWYPPYPWKSGGGTKRGKLAEWRPELGYIRRPFGRAGISLFQVGGAPVAGIAQIEPEGLASAVNRGDPDSVSRGTIFDGPAAAAIRSQKSEG